MSQLQTYAAFDGQEFYNRLNAAGTRETGPNQTDQSIVGFVKANINNGDRIVVFLRAYAVTPTGLAHAANECGMDGQTAIDTLKELHPQVAEWIAEFPPLEFHGFPGSPDNPVAAQPEAPPAPAIAGGRTLSADEIALINEGQALADQCGAFVAKLREFRGAPGATDPLGQKPALDQRWVSIGATHLREGFMALTRAASRNPQLSEDDMSKNTPACAVCDANPERQVLMKVLTLIKAMQDANKKAILASEDPAKKEQAIDLLFDLATLGLVICNNVILPFLNEMDAQAE